MGIGSFSLAAVDSSPKNDKPEVSENVAAKIETKILSEINLVRTNPQGYANWLESQKQYYDGVWLKLPGEKPVRTNKGLKALQEAIAFLKEQQPLSPLDASDLAATDAGSKLKDFATTNNIQNISYGRVTPKGIVMSWVVDELFPDRRRRKSLLNPSFDVQAKAATNLRFGEVPHTWEPLCHRFATLFESLFQRASHRAQAE